MGASDDISSESASQQQTGESYANQSNQAAAKKNVPTRADEPDTSSEGGSSDLPNSNHMIVGWREWVSLPSLGLPAIKAKIDTGARTSAIHALDIERIKRNNGQDWLAFSVQPIQRDASIVRRCEAPLVDVRRVTDSGGHREDRYFISTQVQIGSLKRTIEITLAQRDDMLFRMLIGRTAMIPDIHVDPAQSYSLGRVSARALYSDDAVGANS